jgi:hypothetical protein
MSKKKEKWTIVCPECKSRVRVTRDPEMPASDRTSVQFMTCLRCLKRVYWTFGDNRRGIFAGADMMAVARRRIRAILAGLKPPDDNAEESRERPSQFKAILSEMTLRERWLALLACARMVKSTVRGRRKKK